MFLIAANATLSMVIVVAIIALLARAVRPALAQASAAHVIKLERPGAHRLTRQPGPIRRAA